MDDGADVEELFDDRFIRDEDTGWAPLWLPDTKWLSDWNRLLNRWVQSYGFDKN